jgi:hypothetical protein
MSDAIHYPERPIVEVIFDCKASGKLKWELPAELEAAIIARGNQLETLELLKEVFGPTALLVGKLFNALALVGGAEMLPPLQSVDSAIRKAAADALLRLKRKNN